MRSRADHRPVVQKYGGTSVGSVERIKNIAKRIRRQYDAGSTKIAVVVSAMSGETSRLIDLVKEINPDPSLRHYDLAVSAGEQVSVALMASALEAEGIESLGLLAHQLGIYTDDFHSQARIQTIDCSRLNLAWKEGKIPVIAGFQGITSNGEITTLGRGGSDTSAVALAVALGAEFCEINTDVAGVYTADPRVVPKAKLNRLMDFEVTLEMASLGSKVLHARCVELGAKYKMPIVVRSTFDSDDADRTTIMSLSEKEMLEAPVVSGVTLERNVARITIDGLPMNSKVVADIFKSIAQEGINVDIIVHNKSDTQQTMRLGFSVAGGDLEKTMSTLRIWKPNEEHSISIDKEEDLAKVSVVGLGMRSHAGVASECFTTLAEANIEVKMISTSEIKISCVVASGDADLAAQALHKQFIEE